MVTASHLGSAAALISSSDVKGVIRVLQQTEDQCLFDGTVDGLSPNQSHLVNVHELGDLSNGCQSCGDIFTMADQVRKGKGEGKLGEYATKRVAAGVHFPTPWLFEPAKRPDDRAVYCRNCRFLP